MMSVEGNGLSFSIAGRFYTFTGAADVGHGQGISSSGLYSHTITPTITTI
jgi:hypothetical protein